MTATTAQLLDTVISATSSGLDRGRVRYLHKSADTVPEQLFFADLLAASDSDPVAVYDNPTRKPVHQGPAKPLDAADLAWLQRLPSDPARVTPGDVSILVGMASQAKHPSSEHRLVTSILAPIQRYHAQQEARTAVTNLQRPLPQIPDSVIPALADAIRREMPQLTENEALSRARMQAVDAIARRDADHADRVLDARTRLAAAAESGPA